MRAGFDWTACGTGSSVPPTIQSCTTYLTSLPRAGLTGSQLKCIRRNPTQRTELLQRQLDDLGRQVQTLLKELGRRADPSLPVDAEMGEMDPLPAENIDAVITNNLTFFRRAEPESTQDRPRTRR